MVPPERVGSTSRLGAFLVVTVFTLVVGILFRSPLLVALAEAMGGVIVLSWAACRAALRGLSCERRLLLRAFEDDDVSVQLTVRHAGRMPACYVEVHDQFGADDAPARAAVIQWLPRGSDVVRYDGRCTRGRGSWPLGPIELAVSDPLGLFSLTRRIESVERLVVYPRPAPLLLRDLESPLAGAFSGPREASRPGHTTNFYGLREHRAGEAARRIHWRASARRGRLMLTEFEAPTHTEVALLLDLERAGLRGTGRESNVERSIRAAAAVAQTALQKGHALRLIADDGRPVVLPSRTGEAHLLAVLEALAHVTADGRVPYLELMERATPLIAEGACVVLIFNRPRVEADRFIEVWARWKRRGVNLAAAVLDDPEDSGPGEAASALLERLGVGSGG